MVIKCWWKTEEEGGYDPRHTFDHFGKNGKKKKGCFMVKIKIVIFFIKGIKFIDINVISIKVLNLNFLYIRSLFFIKNI